MAKKIIIGLCAECPMMITRYDPASGPKDVEHAFYVCTLHKAEIINPGLLPDWCPLEEDAA